MWGSFWGFGEILPYFLTLQNTIASSYIFPVPVQESDIPATSKGYAFLKVFDLLLLICPPEIILYWFTIITQIGMRMSIFPTPLPTWDSVCGDEMVCVSSLCNNFHVTIWFPVELQEGIAIGADYLVSCWTSRGKCQVGCKLALFSADLWVFPNLPSLPLQLDFT